MWIPAAPVSAGDSWPPLGAQLVGTVHDTRTAWNPFSPDNAMLPETDGAFAREVTLRADGGRNRDGVYAMRFFADRELRRVFKRGARPGELVTGDDAPSAGNVIFRVPADGRYRVRFDPRAARYSIDPPVTELEAITSMQINGFVHDREGVVETFDGRRTRPAEIWDEGVPAHQLVRDPDGAWAIDLALSASGGHQKNGVYQALLSANGNGDWGFGARLGQPGRLVGGHGYASRVGNVDDTAIVFRVPRDGRYRLTVWPESYRFAIDPPVDFFPGATFQVNGDVVSDPWNPAAPGHAMTPVGDGTWMKQLALRAAGGPSGSGLYAMNFSIDASWALDGIGFGGEWGRTWHSAPQSWSLLFRVPRDGDYRVMLDPARGRFAFDPPVEPVTRIESLELFGDFEAFADDGQGGWNPAHPVHAMQEARDGVFVRELRLRAGRGYRYKYGANRSHWAWTLADHPYDGERRLAPHGDPPPLRFDCPRDGIYRFSADVRTGEYTVVLVRHL